MKDKEDIPMLQLQESMAGIHIEKVSEQNFKPLMKQYLHRDNYYLCMLCRTGSVDFFVEFNSIRLTKNMLMFLYPGQLHRVEGFNKFSGWLLMIDPKLVDDQSLIVFEQSLDEQPVSHLTLIQAKWYNNVMEAAQSLYTADTSDPYIHPALRSLISSIIYRTAALYLFRENNSMARHSRRTIDITKRFRQLLRKNFIAIKRPSEYAGIMNISLSYLNDTVRMVTGFSVSYYIQQEVVREAQRLLCYTGLSIKEIASELNFEDEKYFNRVFSKVSGESPGLFRKKWDTGIADNADTRR